MERSSLGSKKRQSCRLCALTQYMEQKMTEPIWEIYSRCQSLIITSRLPLCTLCVLCVPLGVQIGSAFSVCVCVCMYEHMCKRERGRRERQSIHIPLTRRRWPHCYANAQSNRQYLKPLQTLTITMRIFSNTSVCHLIFTSRQYSLGTFPVFFPVEKLLS